MRRFVLGVIVVLLMFSASGASALVIDEPCTGFEQAERDDGVCPPMCVTCGCCAQAAEPVIWQATNSPDVPVVEVRSLVPLLPSTQARDILHVPKLRVA